MALCRKTSLLAIYVLLIAGIAVPSLYLIFPAWALLALARRRRARRLLEAELPFIRDHVFTGRAVQIRRSL